MSIPVDQFGFTTGAKPPHPAVPAASVPDEPEAKFVELGVAPMVAAEKKTETTTEGKSVRGEPFPSTPPAP